MCADTRANPSIGEERTYKLFQENGVQMKLASITTKLVDGKESTEKSLTANVPADIEGRKIDFVIFSNFKVNTG